MDDKIIKIASFFDYTQAEIAKIALKSEGIECFLSGENFVATYWLYANADGGIKLYIKDSDNQKALQIIKKMYNPDTANEDQSYDLKCPKCNSADINFIRFSRWMFIISMILLRLPVTFSRNIYKCNACSHKWKREKQLP